MYDELASRSRRTQHKRIAAHTTERIQRPYPVPAYVEAKPARVKNVKKKRYAAKILIFMAFAFTLVYAVGVWLPEYMEYVRLQERISQWRAEENRHPLRYRSILEKYADEYSLDPALVASVIKCESSFVPDAVSYLGAKGLMQLMPETAQWVAGKFKGGYTDADLFDPETNIKYGCWLLRYLTDRFGGDTAAIVAGYHAGGGRVSEWLADERYADGGTLNASAIPYGDTRQYVSKVLGAYEVYARHYWSEIPAEFKGV